MNDPRGFTYTETYRHQCEARFIAALPTKAQRDRYFDGDGDRLKPLAALRGADAVARLRADAKAHWQAARAQGKPHRPEWEGSGAEVEVARATGERTNSVPGSGSFLGAANEGNSDPVRFVDSGGLA